MSLLSGVRARFLGAVRAAVQGEPRKATRSAEPGSPELGMLAIARAFGASEPEPRVPGNWESEGAAARVDHQHGWFAQLALAHANGSTDAGKIAVLSMESWLRQDRPGHGVAWEHASDAALRILHWHAGLSWLGDSASTELRAGLAGSAEWHVDWLRAGLPWGSDFGHRRVAHHAGVLVGGLTFPGLARARESWSEAASSLGPALAEATFPDGSPRSGSVPCAMHMAWLATLGAAVAHANGVALPGTATSALSRLLHFIARVAGENGGLPAAGTGVAAFPLDFGDYPLAWSAWNLGLSLGVVSGDPAARAEDDLRRNWFFPGTITRSEPVKPGWGMSSFAEDGWVIASCQVRAESLRVITHVKQHSAGPFANPNPAALWVDLGEKAVILGESDNTLQVTGAPCTRATLCVARVDGKKARIETAADLGNQRRWERDVLLNQQRIFVTDRLSLPGRVRLCWTFGPDWVRDGELPSFKLQNGATQLLVQLPKELIWSAEGNSVVGEGVLAAGSEVVSGFEFR